MLGFITAKVALLPDLLPSAVSVAIFSVWPPLSMPAHLMQKQYYKYLEECSPEPLLDSQNVLYTLAQVSPKAKP